MKGPSDALQANQPGIRRPVPAPFSAQQMIHAVPSGHQAMVPASLAGLIS